MLAQPEVLDALLQDPDGGRELVLGVEAGEWQGPDALRRLQEKLNAYASYALDGQMHEEHPTAKGKPVRITVVSVDEVPAEALALIAKVGEIFGREGVGLSVTRAPAQEAA